MFPPGRNDINNVSNLHPLLIIILSENRKLHYWIGIHILLKNKLIKKMAEKLVGLFGRDGSLES